MWSPLARAFARGFARYLLSGTLASLVVMEFLAPCLLGGGTAVIPEDDGRPLFPYAIERAISRTSPMRAGCGSPTTPGWSASAARTAASG
ncbi:hypothetical protein [Nonomuraea diastatica]|uniref:hypothetical protein n=1 Tax=Nonomuraea diastatica TaxID=1848329 RepID=UPI001FE6AC78|nr:hypothetical protein [Nonomuraea diastatica]